MLTKTLIILVLFTLAGCASPQVINAVAINDWTALGKFDGENGFNERSLASQLKLSNQYSDGSTNHDAYIKSYEKALTLYCSPHNAYLLGVMGKPYQGICDRYPHGWAFRQDYVSGKHSQAGRL